MKHTKGPWQFDEHVSVPRDNNTFAQGANISNLDGKNIATVMISGPWIDDVSEGEGNANYHLITAAPEMLEALETYVNNLEEMKKLNWQDHEQEKRQLINSQVAHHREVKKLIKKAKGEI